MANLAACLDASYRVSKPGSISSKGGAGCSLFRNALAPVVDTSGKIASHKEIGSEKLRLSKNTTLLHFCEDCWRVAGRIGSQGDEGLLYVKDGKRQK